MALPRNAFQIKNKAMCIGDFSMNISKNKSLTPGVNCPNLDIAKFICSLLVIMIHTFRSADHPIAYFYTVNVAARTAVPLFFGITGFLLFGKMSYRDGKLVKCEQNRFRMLRYVKKTIKLYLYWSVATLASMLPGWYLSGWWGLDAVKDAVHAILCKGLLHLWYLLAVIWAVPMIYLLLYMVSIRGLQFIAAALWTLECLTVTYVWLWGDRNVPSFPLAEQISFLHSASSLALPMITVGISVAIDRKPRSQTAQMYRFFAACGIWVCEASFIRFLAPNHDNLASVFVTPFFVYAALDFLTSGKQVSVSSGIQRILRETNLIIYCLHPLLIQVYQLLGMDFGIQLWLLTTVTTVGAACAWSLWQSRRTPKAV
jgi:hypothetical protein